MYLPAFPLQLLLQRLQCAADAPVAVLRGAEILWANRSAQGQGVRRGMRVQAARALACTLHAEEVTEAEVQQGMQALWHTLVQWTPSVEPVAQHPGLFWLDPNGLQDLHPSLQAWSQAVHGALQQLGWHARVAVGFNRYFTYAMACSHPTVCVAADARRERQAAERVWLSQLHVSASLRDALAVLGIHTLGALLALPLSELRQRFGHEAEQMHRMAHATWNTLQAHQQTEPLVLEQAIEPADADHTRLVFALKSMLQKLLPRVQERCEALTKLHLRLQMTAKLSHHECLQPAAPTLDERALVELLRLRLGAITLQAPIESITLRVESTPVTAHQLELLVQKPRRDVRAASAALAKVRAALGDGAVTQARLCDAHLPEGAFVWESMHQVPLPKLPPPPLLPPLMRQVLSTPQALPSPPKRQPEEWLGNTYGIIRQRVGPFRVQLPWWQDAPSMHRDYYYARTDERILWLFESERRWFLQGWVD